MQIPRKKWINILCVLSCKDFANKVKWNGRKWVKLSLKAPYPKNSNTLSGQYKLLYKLSWLAFNIVNDKTESWMASWSAEENASLLLIGWQ